MKIVQLTPGAGAMYCGNCLRDNALIASLRRQGHDAIMLPLYLPLTLDETDQSAENPIFFGGINVYLEQKFPIMKKMPSWLHKFLSSRKLLKLASGKAAATRPEQVGELTLSMLRGEEGNQKRELDELVAFLKEHQKPDIICLSNAMLIGMAKILGSELNCPIVCMLQGEDDFLDALPTKERDMAWSLLSERTAHVSKFVAPTKYFAEKMGSRLQIPEEKIAIIPNAINPDGFKKTTFNDPPILGYFARMCREKGLDIIVDGYIELMKTSHFPNLRLHIGGSCGPSDQSLVDEQIEKLKSHQLFDKVSFFPNVTKEEKIEFFSKLHLFSVPARYSEAYGLYLVEAMASGVPCIQPDVSGFKEILDYTQAGMCYPKNTPSDLSTALTQILSQPEKMKTLGEQGQMVVRNKLNIDAISGSYSDLFQMITRGKL